MESHFEIIVTDHPIFFLTQCLPFANRREHHTNTKDSQPVTQHGGSHIFMPEHTYIIIFLFEITVQPFTLRITEMNPGRMLVQMHADIQYPLRQAIEIMGCRRSVIFRCKRTVFTVPGNLIDHQTAEQTAFRRRDQTTEHLRRTRQQHAQQRIRSQQGTVRLGGIADPFVMGRLVQQITIVAILLKQCVGHRLHLGFKQAGSIMAVRFQLLDHPRQRGITGDIQVHLFYRFRIFGSQSGRFLSSRTQQ